MHRQGTGRRAMLRSFLRSPVVCGSVAGTSVSAFALLLDGFRCCAERRYIEIWSVLVARLLSLYNDIEMKKNTFFICLHTHYPVLAVIVILISGRFRLMRIIQSEGFFFFFGQ